MRAALAGDQLKFNDFKCTHIPPRCIRSAVAAMLHHQVIVLTPCICQGHANLNVLIWTRQDSGSVAFVQLISKSQCKAVVSPCDRLLWCLGTAELCHYQHYCLV
jgi:hypothetical protein